MSTKEKEVEVGFDALRVCEAISKIGYEPHTAVMDIIDNSVTANATEVFVTLKLREGRTLKSRNSVRYYQIIDNGRGMDHGEIINAFKLGSDRNYKPNSLSKYGMGLKAAGLSLGTRISIISKKDGIISNKYVFDLEKIEELGRLSIIQKELTPEQVKNSERLLSKKSGTIVEISGCENINQSSPGSTVTKLRDRLGVVYYSFLQKAKPLKIKLRVSPHNSDEEYDDIQPKDLLFLDEASKHTGWDPETYDFVSPYLVLDRDWDSFKDKYENDLPPIRVKAVAFPQASMAGESSPLSSEDKQQVKAYQISRENSGFFIYRNGRLIRWGDSLEGPSGKPLITKDDINVRFRFEILDEHDDILHVDVSKQRLEIDDEILGTLEKIVKQAIRTAKEIRQACQEKIKTRHGEGETFNLTLRDVSEDDPQEADKGAPNKLTLERQQKKQREALKELNAEEAKDPLKQHEDSDTSFKKIRYSDTIPARQLWKAYFDSVEGVYTYINKSHPFYEEFISRFEDGTKERLTIEALIFSAAVAENNVFNHETDIDTEKLENAFRRFHKNIDSFLVDWTYENQEGE
ncbi:ATP-binding protein [Stutzerimonas stutzeri]|uniref:ATP-binding protein n=1 Tax=Stutzerimonas TaxID=2901164 RepID=UPI001BAEDEDC|nr:ATP-binding protein [Stutzerimonas stutzeri]QUE77473.1 ATP-binding protein [Stutzerimonas stutzeri]